MLLPIVLLHGKERNPVGQIDQGCANSRDDPNQLGKNA